MPKFTQPESVANEAVLVPRTANCCRLSPIFLSGVARAEDSSALRAIFADPPRQYSTGPLWTWNDLLTEEQVVATLRDLAAQKVRQVWVHPQPGLMTPYLSPDWFRRRSSTRTSGSTTRTLIPPDLPAAMCPRQCPSRAAGACISAR